MAIVCQQCGALGYADLLVYCGFCHRAAQHQYCMEAIPNSGEDIKWSCEDCNLRSLKLSQVANGQGLKIPNNNICLSAKTNEYLYQDRERHLIPNNNKIITCNDLHDDCISRGGKNGPNFHFPKNHGTKGNHNKKAVRSKKQTSVAYVDPIRSEGTTSQPLEWSKPKCRRRKLILPDEDDDLINGIQKESPLGIRIDFPKNTISLHRSFGKNKPIDHRRKLVLSDEEDEPHNLETKLLQETIVCLKNNEMNEGELASHNMDSEMTTKTTKIKRGGNSMKNLSEHSNRRDDTRDEELQNLQESCSLKSEFYFILAMPIKSYSWRGWFEICGRAYGPLTAHLSTKVGEKAFGATRSLPPIIQLTRVSRSHAWPRCFGISPTDDNIALFFFPVDSGVEEMIDQLLKEVIEHDLVLKVVLDEAEMLVFPSVLLPKDHKRYQGKYYLWSVFRRKDSETSDREIRIEQTEENSTKQPVPNPSIGSEQAQTKMENEEISLEGDEPEASLCHLTDEDVGTDGCGRDEELINGCLDLFPMQVENIAFLKMGNGKKGVDLELGLGL